MEFLAILLLAVVSVQELTPEEAIARTAGLCSREDASAGEVPKTVLEFRQSLNAASSRLAARHRDRENLDRQKLASLERTFLGVAGKREQAGAESGGSLRQRLEQQMRVLRDDILKADSDARERRARDKAERTAFESERRSYLQKMRETLSKCSVPLWMLPGYTFPPEAPLPAPGTRIGLSAAQRSKLCNLIPGVSDCHSDSNSELKNSLNVK